MGYKDKCQIQFFEIGNPLEIEAKSEKPKKMYLIAFQHQISKSRLEIHRWEFNIEKNHNMKKISEEEFLSLENIPAGEDFPCKIKHAYLATDFPQEIKSPFLSLLANNKYNNFYLLYWQNANKTYTISHVFSTCGRDVRAIHGGDNNPGWIPMNRIPTYLKYDSRYGVFPWLKKFKPFESPEHAQEFTIYTYKEIISLIAEFKPSLQNFDGTKPYVFTLYYVKKEETGEEKRVEFLTNVGNLMDAHHRIEEVMMSHTNGQIRSLLSKS